jgi:hypothetical protein
MMYPFMTLNDDTEITHSEMKEDGSVRVYIETPDTEDGFHSAECWLPEYRWEKIQGYNESEMAFFKQLIRKNAHVILEFAQDGGVLDATIA